MTSTTKQIPITLRPNSLVASGRTSYSGVIQLLPKKGGIRECFVPRKGYLFFSVDYTGMELATHAQSCIWSVGYSKLADALNRKIKIHDALAATIGGVDYDTYFTRPDLKPLRVAAKAANFTFPGGGGEYTTVKTQRAQGPDTKSSTGKVYKGLRFCITMRGASYCGGDKNTMEWKRRPITPTCLDCLEAVRDLKASWLKQWPENVEMFALASSVEDGDPKKGLLPGQVRQHVSGRIRGGLDFCSAANTLFQGLGADGAKAALFRAQRECFDQTLYSPLFGSSVTLFSHDEFFGETPESAAHLAVPRLSEIAVEEMRKYTPDVAIEAPPTIMRRWHKAAEPVYREGRLIPWEPS